MTAVLASYVKLSTMVDGTLRVVLDIEPKHAADAFALLGSPGTPIAIARITNEAAVAHDTQQPAERKPLSLASKVALTCQQPTFWDFLRDTYPDCWHTVRDNLADAGDIAHPEYTAAEVVRRLCGVSSRSDVREGTKAAAHWGNIQAQLHDWQRRSGT